MSGALVRYVPRSGALIRYAAPRIARYIPKRSFTRAFAAGSLAEPMAKRARRSFGRRRIRFPRATNRRKKASLKRRVGERIGTSVAKASAGELNNFSLNTKQLYQTPLLTLLPTTDQDSTTGRLRQTVNFRGVKFCINWDSVASTISTLKLYCHIAIVSPKGCATQEGEIGTDDFFRSQGDSSNRAVNFEDFRSGMDMYCLPINTDKYNVHKHKRFAIGPTDATNQGREKMNTFYLPLKRQIRYKPAPSPEPEGKNMFLLMWCSAANEAAGAPGFDAARINLRLVKYFREPRGT